MKSQPPSDEGPTDPAEVARARAISGAHLAALAGEHDEIPLFMPSPPGDPLPPHLPPEGWDFLQLLRNVSPLAYTFLVDTKEPGRWLYKNIMPIEVGRIPVEIAQELMPIWERWRAHRGDERRGGASWFHGAANCLAREIILWATKPDSGCVLKWLADDPGARWEPVSDVHGQGARGRLDIDGSALEMDGRKYPLRVFPELLPESEEKAAAGVAPATKIDGKPVRRASEKQVSGEVAAYLAGEKQAGCEPNTDRCWEAVRCILPGATRSQVRDAYQKLTGHRPRGRRPRKP